MVSRLTNMCSHEAENSLEISLREAFIFLESKLRPPFSLAIPTKEEYSTINRAILYGILCESHLAKVHIKHLHGKSTDGYEYFTSLLINITNELYVKLLDVVKIQLIWVTNEMINVLAVGFEGLLVSLLRQIVGGDFGEGNLWLCFEMVSLLSSNWDCLLDEEPLVLSSALYVFLRLLTDHYQAPNVKNLECLREMEIKFCVKMLRQEFALCLRIGRDLIRLLQDLVHIPEFAAIWKDLLCCPSVFKLDGFSDISQIYCTKTSREYFLLRITPEMESQLRFLLTHVKWGCHKRHQIWFAKKFIAATDRKAVVIDIIRFICSVHHPSSETNQSHTIPRWALTGWLLQSGLKNYLEANAKLSLFYDWLFFDEKVDDVTNIEPAFLLMVNSIPSRIDITHSLLEFLFLLSDTYDTDRPEVVRHGISTALCTLVKNGAGLSFDALTNCDMLSQFLKERLRKMQSNLQFLC